MVSFGCEKAGEHDEMRVVQRHGRANDVIAELAQCEGWLFWSQALGIESAGGGYVVEYIFFIMFSVSFGSAARQIE